MNGNILLLGNQNKLNPAQKHMLKVSNINTRKRCETCSMFWCQLRTYFTLFSSISIVDYEQVNVCWVRDILLVFFIFSGFKDLKAVTFAATHRIIGMYPDNVTSNIKIKKTIIWIQY